MQKETIMMESTSQIVQRMYLKGAMDVGKGLAVGIVAVDGKSLHGDDLGDSLQQLANSARGADSDGITQRDLVASHIVQLL